MTSLLGKLLRFFPGPVRREDLFTEAVARLFERNPKLCLKWMRNEGLISSGAAGASAVRLRVEAQKRLVATEDHEAAGVVDLFIEIYRPLVADDTDAETRAEAVMIESKIGSPEGTGQLRKYAEYLAGMKGYGRKTLLYITRSNDPKNEDEILSGLEGSVKFKQLRWYDFHRLLAGVEGDTMVEEVKIFMQEQGMARSYRFSAADLAALSGMPRASAILAETLGGEVRARLEKLAGHKLRRNATDLEVIRDEESYYIYAYPSDKGAIRFWAGFWLLAPDGYPMAEVGAHVNPGAAESIAALRRVVDLEGWEGYNLDEPDETLEEPRVSRKMSLALALSEEDHVAAVQRFFVKSLDQLGDKLADLKKERPNLPWVGK